MVTRARSPAPSLLLLLIQLGHKPSSRHGTYSWSCLRGGVYSEMFVLILKLRRCWRADRICLIQAAFHVPIAVIASLPVRLAYVLMTAHLPDLWLFFRSPVLLISVPDAHHFPSPSSSTNHIEPWGWATPGWISTVFLGKAALARLYIEYSVNGILWIWATLHCYSHCTWKWEIVWKKC